MDNNDLDQFHANLQELAKALAHHEASKAAWLEFADLTRQYERIDRTTPEAESIRDKLRIVIARLDELKSQLPERFRAGLD